MQRRFFLSSAAAAATAPLSAAAREVETLADGQPTIDVNAYVGAWPFARLRHEDPTALADSLKKQGVSQAWTGSFEALLHHDLDAVNRRLVKTCRDIKGGPFKPMGAINPKLSSWRETFRRCRKEHRMIGFRLHPNYHGYTLDDPDFLALLDAAQSEKAIIQIALRMEAPERQHRAVAAPDVDPRPLLDFLESKQGHRIQFLNALSVPPSAKTLKKFAGFGVQFDTAWLAQGIGIESLLEQGLPAASLVFGSFAPYLSPDDALQRLTDSRLATAESISIRCHNVENFLTTA